LQQIDAPRVVNSGRFRLKPDLEKTGAAIFLGITHG
jgi:hypothetical protein